MLVFCDNMLDIMRFKQNNLMNSDVDLCDKRSEIICMYDCESGRLHCIHGK